MCAHPLTATDSSVFASVLPAYCVDTFRIAFFVVAFSELWPTLLVEVADPHKPFLLGCGTLFAATREVKLRVIRYVRAVSPRRVHA